MSEQTLLSQARTLHDLIPGEAWRSLTALPHRSHTAGQTLLRQGEAGTHVLALIQGLVKVVRRSVDGRDKLLSFRGPGEVLGEVAVQDGNARLADVLTLTKCKVASVPAAAFRDLVRQYDLTETLNRLALSRLREQTEAGEGDLDQRLAATLLRLMALSGGHSFRLTRLELAQHLGVGRGTVSEALRRLEPGCVRAGRTSIEVVDEHWLLRTLQRRASTRRASRRPETSGRAVR
ncbi:Crp/Fnr family transcriptional regulator [Streptomyces dangxiongensis]|uniref:Crp/Fnr family transcriptional regulator n=1 Tax=Streptomyces dangxiongensis TaxID=1442032 RepID=A0A3G2J8I1_9ACTN|nr:Crp/Fnr family transcriptional regulator [Streptomyces dangxiongensis]AYN38570.1 Crp/Fnr family transcriptional regulator [Streptomyces dangxiongensis]